MSSQDLLEPEFRLPGVALHRRYAIRLTPDLEGASPGHGDGLDLEVRLHEATEFLHLSAPSELAPGRYTLHIVFAGVLNDRLCGLYKSTYRDDDDNEHVIATTQFEETDARRAFPCFDEPAMKAVFSITLDVPPGQFAVSNSSEISSEA